MGGFLTPKAHVGTRHNAGQIVEQPRGKGRPRSPVQHSNDDALVRGDSWEGTGSARSTASRREVAQPTKETEHMVQQW